MSSAPRDRDFQGSRKMKLKRCIRTFYEDVIFLLHGKLNGANGVWNLRGDIHAMNEKIDIPAAAQMPEPQNQTILDLKASREARGFSLNDVFYTTRVSLINLRALESWDFNRLPPPVYTRNFIRKYAQAIGVDDKPILNHYETHLEGLKPPREEKETKKKSWPKGLRYFFLFGSLAIAIVAGIIVYPLDLHDRLSRLFFPTRSGESTPSTEVGPAPPFESSTMSQINPLPESPPIITTATTEKMSIPAPVVPASQPLSVKATEKALHLIIEAKELTWARITEDHHSSSQVLLKPGDRIERRASDFFQLDIGNAGGIDLIFQGKPMGSIGKRGQVIHIRLPDKEQERRTP
jgi:cytoskeleton protein RodZ